MSREVVIDHVSFGYGATPVLDDVTLAVAPGEFFAFLGPSGCGKTTLLRLIAGFSMPASGRILSTGAMSPGLPQDNATRDGVPELRAVAPHDCRGNVAFGLEIRSFPAEATRRVRDALAPVGLANTPTRQPNFPAASSSGSLSPEPWSSARCPVLDEPLSNLDALRIELRSE